MPPAFVISALRARIAAFMRDMSFPLADTSLRLMLSTTRSQGLLPKRCFSTRAFYYFSCSTLLLRRSFVCSVLVAFHFCNSCSACDFRSFFAASSCVCFPYSSYFLAYLAYSTFAIISSSSSVQSSSIV